MSLKGTGRAQRAARLAPCPSGEGDCAEPRAAARRPPEAWVAAAVRAFDGRLPAHRLELVREALREALGADPVVHELLGRIAASAPEARGESGAR